MVKEIIKISTEIVRGNIVQIEITDSQEFGNLRVVERDGEQWFVAADVCRTLDIRTDSVRTILDADEGQEGQWTQLSESLPAASVRRSRWQVASTSRAVRPASASTSRVRFPSVLSIL